MAGKSPKTEPKMTITKMETKVIIRIKAIMGGDC
jgi:hypothetical protein